MPLICKRKISSEFSNLDLSHDKYIKNGDDRLENHYLWCVNNGFITGVDDLEKIEQSWLREDREYEQRKWVCDIVTQAVLFGYIERHKHDIHEPAVSILKLVSKYGNKDTAIKSFSNDCDWTALKDLPGNYGSSASIFGGYMDCAQDDPTIMFANCQVGLPSYCLSVFIIRSEDDNRVSFIKKACGREYVCKYTHGDVYRMFLTELKSCTHRWAREYYPKYHISDGFHLDAFCYDIDFNLTISNAYPFNFRQYVKLLSKYFD